MNYDDRLCVINLMRTRTDVQQCFNAFRIKNQSVTNCEKPSDYLARRSRSILSGGIIFRFFVLFPNARARPARPYSNPGSAAPGRTSRYDSPKNSEVFFEFKT